MVVTVGPKIKKVTGQQILDAIIQNGYIHNHVGWFGYEHSVDKPAKISAACVMGQAALNLGVTQSSVTGSLGDDDNLPQYPDLNEIAWKMISYNDEPTKAGNRRNYSDLVRIAKRQFAPILNREFDMEEAEYDTVKGSK